MKLVSIQTNEDEMMVLNSKLIDKYVEEVGKEKMENIFKALHSLYLGVIVAPSNCRDKMLDAMVELGNKHIAILMENQ